MIINQWWHAGGGNLVWGPQSFATVPIINGRFNVILGTTDSLGRSIAEAFNAANRYLGIKVNSLTELAPRQQILTTAYAVQSNVAQTVRGPQLYVHPSTNNVGIGTTTPTSKLEVMGEIKANKITANNIGSVFIRWGNGTCPTTTNLLYSGFAFNEHYTHVGGGAEATCVTPGDPGAIGPGNLYGDLLNLVVSGGDRQRMPPGIIESRKIKCAQCYADGPNFVAFGTDNCPTGWTVSYSGYAMGAYYTYSKSNRHCVDNVNFDSSVTSSTYGDVWSGTVLWDNTDVGIFETNRYVKCAVCIKR